MHKLVNSVAVSSEASGIVHVEDAGKEALKLSSVSDKIIPRRIHHQTLRDLFSLNQVMAVSVIVTPGFAR